MTTLATSDLSWAAIQSILGDTGDAALDDLCNHANVDALGLDAAYCAGDGPAARLVTLQTAPYKMGNFRGYQEPNNRIFITDLGDHTVYRAVFGEKLHSSKYWSAGFEYYTGAAFVDFEFNQLVRTCYTQDIDDYIVSYGNVNNWVYGPVGVGSPVWDYRFTGQDDPLANEAGTDSLATGSYYWGWQLGWSGFYSNDFGEGDFFGPFNVADYLLSDPDEYLAVDKFGGGGTFNVWTGVYTSTSIASGAATLTGGTNGTGNRGQGWSIPYNPGGPRVSQITTSGSGVSASHVYIYQNG